MRESVSIESGGVPLVCYGTYQPATRTFDIARIETGDGIENIAPLLSVSLMAELSEACATSIHFQHCRREHDLEAIAAERACCCRHEVAA